MTLPAVAAAPTSLALVTDQCSAIESWAEQCESVPELRDASNKLAAIDEYLTRTSTDGRARVAAAMRRLEVRIGTLIGPAPDPVVTGAQKGSFANEASDLTPNQRSAFRQMAANPEAVEDVIEQSTDDAPASRRKVMDNIKHRTKPTRSPLASDAERAGWQFRKSVERLEAIAEDDRFRQNKSQVAAHLHGHLVYAIEVCQDLVNQLTKEP